MFWNIINEMFYGNFSFTILVTNVLQFIVGVAALIFAIKTYFNTRKK